MFISLAHLADVVLHGMWVFTLDARGLLALQWQGKSEQVVLVGERPLAQAVKSFQRADPITLPFISLESKFDPEDLIGGFKKRVLRWLPRVLTKIVLIEHELENET